MWHHAHLGALILVLLVIWLFTGNKKSDRDDNRTIYNDADYWRDKYRELRQKLQEDA